jgi:hypothetical protein
MDKILCEVLFYTNWVDALVHSTAFVIRQFGGVAMPWGMALRFNWLAIWDSFQGIIFEAPSKAWMGRRGNGDSNQIAMGLCVAKLG